MNYKSSNIAIIIPSTNYKNIKSCIDSIQRQTKKPGQTIIVFNKKKNFKKKKNIIFSYINKSNQVHQRTHALSFLNKNIKLILQLDDKFYLDEKAIENLTDEWNTLPTNVAGIGIKSDFKYDNLNKFKLLKCVTLTGSDEPGKVLVSGFNNKLVTSKKYVDVDWLQGGLSSWRLKYVSKIFNRKFPVIKWSILEDLIFSYSIKVKGKFKLKFSNSIKAYVIKSDMKEFKIKELYFRGYQYSKMHKVFVYINKNKLSKIAFYYSYISSSILGILWCSFRINKKIFFYLGRLVGIFVNIKKK